MDIWEKEVILTSETNLQSLLIEYIRRKFSGVVASKKNESCITDDSFPPCLTSFS